MKNELKRPPGQDAIPVPTARRRNTPAVVPSVMHFSSAASLR